MKGIRKLFFGLLLFTIVGISCQVQAKADVDSVTYSTSSGLSGSFSLPDLAADETATVYANYGGTSSSDLTVCTLDYNSTATTWSINTQGTGFTVSGDGSNSFSFTTSDVSAQKSEIRTAISENASGNISSTTIEVYIDCADTSAEDSDTTEVKGVKPTGSFEGSNVDADKLAENITFSYDPIESSLADKFLFEGETYRITATSATGWLDAPKAKKQWTNGVEGQLVSPNYVVNTEINGSYPPFVYTYDVVENITLNSSLGDIEKGVKQTKTATVSHTGSAWSAADITWSASSADITVATTTTGVEVTGNVVGTGYVLKATIVDGKYPGGDYVNNTVDTFNVIDTSAPEPAAIDLELSKTTITVGEKITATIKAISPSSPGAVVDPSKVHIGCTPSGAVTIGTVKSSGDDAYVEITGQVICDNAIIAVTYDGISIPVAKNLKVKDTVVEPTSITLVLSESNVDKGREVTATITKTPSTAALDLNRLTLVSSNSKATVGNLTLTATGDATAQITGIEEGSVTITAEYTKEDGTKLAKSEAPLTINASSSDVLEGLEFSPGSIAVAVGATETIYLKAIPSTFDLSNALLDNTVGIQRSSQKYADISIKSSGKIEIKGVKDGDFTFTATYKNDTSIKAICTVTVGEGSKSGINVVLSDTSINVGDTVVATVSSKDGTALDKDKVSLKAETSGYATIGSAIQKNNDVEFTIKGEKKGTAKLTATYSDGGNNVTSNVVSLEIKEPTPSGDLKGITMSPDTLYVGSNGMKKTVKVIPNPTTYNLTFDELKLSCSSTSYFTASKSSSVVGCVVTGSSEGKGKLIATVTQTPSLTASCDIIVVGKADFDLEWDCPSSLTKSSSKTITVEADDGTSLDYEDLEITSSNSSVVSVTQSSSSATAVLKGVSAGTATIKASYADENGYATIYKTVTVSSSGGGDTGDFEIEYYPDTRTLNVTMPKSLTKSDGTVVDNITGFYIKFKYNGTELANTSTKYSTIFQSSTGTSKATVDAKFFEDLTNNTSNQSLFSGDSPKIDFYVYPVANSTIIDSIELSESATLYKITLGSTNSTYFTYKVSLGGTDTEKSYFYGLKNQTFKVTASPKDGYAFSRWSDSNYTSNPIDSYKVTTSTTLYAVATTSTSSSSSSLSSSSSSTTSKYTASGGAGGSGNYDDVPRTGESKTDIWVLWSVLLLSILIAGFMIYRRFGLVKAITRIEDQEKADAIEAAEKEREENLKKVTDLRNLK